MFKIMCNGSGQTHGHGQTRKKQVKLNLILNGCEWNVTCKYDVKHTLADVNRSLFVVEAFTLGSHFNMMRRRMMLREVVGSVVESFIPTHSYLLLNFHISKPMASHIPRFGAFLLHVVMHKTSSSGFVYLKRCWWLWMAKWFESMSHKKLYLCIYKYSCCFCFCCRGHYMSEGLINDKDCSIDRWWRINRVAGEIVMSYYTALGIRKDQVRCIAVNIEDHVTSILSRCYLWACGCIVHHLLTLLEGAFCWIGLSYSNVIQCCKHRVIKGSSIVKKRSCNGLNMFGFIFY